MAELIRDIVIDATPDTIWPFLTDASKHVEWLGTVAEIDPQPGGTYRVLVGGQHQSAGEFVEVVPKETTVVTLAHIAGMPVEESLMPFMITAGAALVGVRAMFGSKKPKGALTNADPEDRVAVGVGGCAGATARQREGVDSRS